MNSNMKRFASLMLVLVMVFSLLPTNLQVFAADEPQPQEIGQDAYAEVDTVFDLIDKAESAPAKKNATDAQKVEDAIAIVLASDSYVEGSLEQNGNFFTWETDDGIRCAYSPRMREIDEKRTPETSKDVIVNEPVATKGGSPAGNQVYLIGPYYGSDSSFTDQYKKEAKRVAETIGDTDGYTLYSGKAATDARRASDAEAPLPQVPVRTSQTRAQAQPEPIKHPSKAEIVLKRQTVTSSKTTFATNPSVVAPYATGSLTDEFLETGITYLNYIRFVAGLPEVTLDEALNLDAQHGAVLLAAIDQLTHYPYQPADMDDEFYNQGYKATTSSNISYRWGYDPLSNIKNSIQGCMDDNSSLGNLTTVGHRRWLLNPALGKVGFGYAESASGASYIVTKVFDQSSIGCTYDFISWPVAGNQPVDLFHKNNPWSVTLNTGVFQMASADSVKVTVTRESDGTQWTFDGTTGQPNTDITPYLTVNDQWYGLPNCIIFHPGTENVDGYQGIYSVNISGIFYRDGSPAELNYTVDFFDVVSACPGHNYTPVVTAPTCTEQGYTTYSCSICGYSYKSDYVDVLGHDWGEWYTIQEPTCFMYGQERSDCTRCEYYQIRIIPCSGHKYNPTVTYPTCTDYGYTTYTCRCGDSYIDDYVDPLDHNYVDGTCANCGEAGPSVDARLTFALNSDGQSYMVSNCLDSASGTLVIPSTYKGKPVTSIGDYAFYHCTSLTNVIIPDSVTSIGDSVFYECSSLTSVTIGDSVTSIGGSAFCYCSSLTSVTIPDSVTSIGDFAFYDCQNLTSVTIGNGVTSIGESAFDSCDSLTSITIPDSVTSIGDYAFYDCHNLISVTIGNGVTKIGNNAFSNCSSLTSITIPDSVTSISDYAFWQCTGLTSINIPSSVTSIGERAFYDCTSLTSVTYCGTEQQWNQINIGSYNTELINATRSYHNYVNSVCSICGMPCEHEYTAAVTAPTCTETGYTTYTCSACGDSYTETLPATGEHTYADGTCSVCGAADPNVPTGPIEDAKLNFFSVGLSLGGTIGVQFVLDGNQFDVAYDDMYVVVYMDVYDSKGVATRQKYVLDEWMETSGYFGVELGVAPRLMGREMTVQAFATKDGIEYCGAVKTYTIKQGIMERLEKAYPKKDTNVKQAKLCTLLVDMLYYGAEAQLRFTQQVYDGLVTEGLDEKYVALATKTDPEIPVSNLPKPGTVNEIFRYDLSVAEAVEIQFSFTLEAGVHDQYTVRIQYGTEVFEYTSESFNYALPDDMPNLATVVFSKLPAKHMREEVTVVLLKNGEPISQTYTASIVAVGQPMSVNGHRNQALVKAMMRYGDSAAAYFAE